MRKLVLLFILAFVSVAFPLGMTIENNGFVNFGNLAPGEGEYVTFAGGSYTETVVSFSTSGGPPGVDLSVSCQGVVGPVAMPLSALRFKTTYIQRVTPFNDSSSTGTLVPLVPNQIPIKDVLYDTGWSSFVPGAMPVFADPATLPTSYQLKMIWGVRVPSNQQAGTYFANIWFTLTGN